MAKVSHCFDFVKDLLMIYDVFCCDVSDFFADYVSCMPMTCLDVLILNDTTLLSLLAMKAQVLHAFCNIQRFNKMTRSYFKSGIWFIVLSC